MKIACISDTHGQLPDSLPKHDILVHAGDICPNFTGNEEYNQEQWLKTVFLGWCKNNDVKHCLGVYGNHDFVGHKLKNYVTSRFSLFESINYGEYYGIKWGFCPYSLLCDGWAFGLNEAGLKEKFDAIPPVDILVTHGPGKWHGDHNGWGSYALLHYIEQKRPKLVVCGHIHEGRGIHHYEGTTIINCALLNEHYKLVNKPIVIETDWTFKINE